MPKLFSLAAIILLGLWSNNVLAQSASGTSSVANPAPVSSATSTAAPTAPPTTSNTSGGAGAGTSSALSGGASEPPDVYLNVPQLSVGRIELDVNNLQADLNLNAQVARYVQLILSSKVLQNVSLCTGLRPPNLIKDGPS